MPRAETKQRLAGGARGVLARVNHEREEQGRSRSFLNRRIDMHPSLNCIIETEKFHISFELWFQAKYNSQVFIVNPLRSC